MLVKLYKNYRADPVRKFVYGPLRVTLLGDALYACHSICTAVQEGRMHFLFTCKAESHPWITEQVKQSEMKRHEKRHGTGVITWHTGIGGLTR
jgi:hypothetical protein